MSDDEIRKLKEELKKELLQEIKKSKEETPWQKIRNEYSDKMKKYNYIEHWNNIDCNGNPIARDFDITVDKMLMNALGNILKAKFKTTSVTKINDYENAKKIAEDFIKIMEEKIC